MAHAPLKDVHMVEYFTDERLSEYQRWRDSGMTRVMLGLLKRFFVPAGLSADAQTGERALYYAGSVDTSHQMLEVLTDLDEVVLGLRKAQKMSGIKPDYGAESILRSEGLTTKKGKK